MAKDILCLFCLNQLMLRSVLKGSFPELSGVQIVALANYMPEQADEAYTLLPSLKARILFPDHDVDVRLIGNCDSIG